MSQQPQKLSATMANQRPLYAGEPTTFLRAHRRVSKLRVTVQEHGQRQPFDVQEYDETNVEPTIDCSNPQCWGGGFHLKPFLEEAMIYKYDDGKPIAFETTEPCCGHEGTRTRTDRRCYHSFTIKVNVEFKKLESQPTKQEETK